MKEDGTEPAEMEEKEVATKSEESSSDHDGENNSEKHADHTNNENKNDSAHSNNDNEESASDDDDNDNNMVEESQEAVVENDGDSSSESEEEEEEATATDTKKSPKEDGAPENDGDENNDKKRKTHDDEGPLPELPLKRARTAYFIFADEKRPEAKLQHPGEGVATIAKAIGALWSALQPTEKEIYETQAAKERARIAHDTQRLKAAGLWPVATSESGEQNNKVFDTVIFPIGRIRKICKLDPDVKGISKESAMLITKAAEMFCAKLGKECVTVAQMQNRRKLMPEDVVDVCSTKESFMFLRPDIKDLRKQQVDEANAKEKENSKKGSKSSGSGGGGGDNEDGAEKNTMMNYFGKVRN